MLPEGAGRISGALGQVIIEGGLLAPRLAFPDPAGLVPLDFTDLVSQSIRHTPNRIACCHRWDKRRPGASQGMLAGPMTFSPRRVPLQIV